MSKIIPNKPKSSMPFTAEGEAPVAPKRIYKGTQEVDHDLFKLNAAKMAKNVSYTDVPQIEHFEHCHIFHTVDSGGRKQETSSAVGGHHHDIEVVEDANGVPSLKVSEPRKWIKKKIRGVMQRVSVAIVLDEEDGTTDSHTHEVTYLGSERITMRQANVEFAKFEVALKSKREFSVEGVI